MRWSIFLSLLTFFTVVYSWSKDDYEIFDLVSALVTAEGKGTDFYNYLSVEPSASQNEITKAYRRKSLELHPDKNPGVKNIQERFARLGVIAQILRDPEKRERYNFFHKNGVPVWRGTGYYYSRFRPSLLHVLLFLILISSLFHLLIMRLNYNKDKRRVRYFTDSALSSAGVKKIVDDVNGTIESLKELSEGKKEKVVQKSKEKDNGGRRRKVKVPMVEGSDHHGFLELVVDGNKVFLPQEDGSMTPLSTLTTPPSIWRTWPIQFSLFLARKTSSHLPSSLQDKLPLSIRPQPEIEVESEDESEIDTPTKGRVKTMRRSATPRDTPTTEESDDVEGKKKKHGVGKASAARRRKMAMKR